MLRALASGDPEQAHATHWRHVQPSKDPMIMTVETTQTLEVESAGKSA
jgi:DNA-binding FadR family transcriptional regulator